MTSVKQSRQVQSPNTYRQGLSSRLQQIVQLLYKNNGQFAKGLPSQHQFQEMLSHCFNCYDQLDFIILEYSRHSVNYLDPKMVAQHMHRIMRVTKYLFSNLRHWVESYSLDIVKKTWEEKSYFPTEAAHQVRCSSCNMYLQEMALKEAKHDIFGWQECRQLFQEELKQTKQEEESKKPLTVKETTEYVGSVNYLTRIIKEMEDSAHSYSKLTETIEKEENHEDMALRFLQQLLSSMRRRIGEKCIYRLKKVIKNWDKMEGEEHDGQCKKPAFKIKQIINQNYIPHANNSSEIRKTVQTNISASMLKKFKDENHQLQIECNTLKASFAATKNNLTFLEKREEIQKKEIERLMELLAEKGMERNSLANQLRASRRNTIKPHTEPDQSLKLTVNVNAYAKQKLLTQTQKNKKYSKFKVKRISRQSEAFSNQQDKTLYFTNDQNRRQNQRIHTEVDHNDDSSDEEQMTQIRTAEVGCQWEDLYCSERQSKLKDKSIRNSKMTASNRERMTIPKNNKNQQEETEKKQLNMKKPSLKALDQNLKSRGNFKQDNRISYEEQKTVHRDNHTLNKLIESMQNKVSQAQLTSPKGSTEKFKVSVKVLDVEPSALKTSLQKINIYDKDSKTRELRPLLHENKAIIKELPEVDKNTRFTQQLKKIINCRMATEGNQVKKKVLKARNTLFRPQHLEFFGGVSESYAYQRASFVEEKLKDHVKKYILVLKNYLVNLRNFKNHLYDNIVMFLKCPFSLIDKDELETKIIGDKQLTSIVSKFVLFHSHKCQSLNCEHLQSFNALIGLPHFQ